MEPGLVVVRHAHMVFDHCESLVFWQYNGWTEHATFKPWGLD